MYIWHATGKDGAVYSENTVRYGKLSEDERRNIKVFMLLDKNTNKTVFSLQLKPSQTFFYRARVLQTLRGVHVKSWHILGYRTRRLNGEILKVIFKVSEDGSVSKQDEWDQQDCYVPKTWLLGEEP